jgi:acyl-CoA synthetase (AMP-forming)/AMP-acid ligase II
MRWRFAEKRNRSRRNFVEAPWHNLSDAVFHHAERHPDTTALIEGGKTITWAALASLTAKAAVYLKNLGIEHGQHVGISLSNSAEHIILSLAALRIGATVIELPADLSAGDMAARGKKFAITASFADAGGVIAPSPIAIRISRRWLDEISTLSGDARHDGPPDDCRMIILSSGSTGIPKGLVTTQRQLMLRAEVSRNCYGDDWTEANPGIMLLPSTASMAFVLIYLYTQILTGGPIVLLPKFSQVIDLVNAIGSYKDAICPVVPAMARGFITCADDKGMLFPAIRFLIVTGLPLAGHEKQALISRVTPNAHEVYGCGGFSRISHLTPADMLTHPGSVGRPVRGPGDEIEIAGADGNAAPPGVEGRLRVRGPRLSLGFFNPEDNLRGAERFAEGWYYPGDILVAGEGGYLYMRGRADDAIAAGPLTIYPPEIEDVLIRHPGVAEAVVVPRPNNMGGVDLVGFIVGRPGLRHQDVEDYCIANLPAVKRPKSVYYLDAIPRTGNGKIDRPAIKEAAIRLAAKV